MHGLSAVLLLAGPWMVYIRWVKDSVKYNEWMNPIDYEVDDTPAKSQPQAPLPGTLSATSEACALSGSTS